MKLTPYSKKPIVLGAGLVTADGLIYVGNGEVIPVEDLPPRIKLYAHSADIMYGLLRQGKCIALKRRQRFVKWRIGTTDVIELRDQLKNLDVETAWQALCQWRKWVTESGGVPTSLAGSSWSIFRTTLPAGVIAAASRYPFPTEELAFGGRQEGKTGVFDNVSLWDIRSAYQASMRDTWIAAAYGEIYRARKVNFRHPGFTAASVGLPRWEFGPIPEIHRKKGTGRIRARYPAKGLIEGIWDNQELEMANAIGCRIYIRQQWLGRAIKLPWRKWSAIMTTGRELNGTAGKLAKLTANSLWGAFASSAEKQWIKCEDGVFSTVAVEKAKTPPCAAISSHVASHVRVRLFTEALWIGEPLIAAHTDSMIAPAGFEPYGPMGNEIGHWRKDADAIKLEILNPQTYRYKTAPEAEWENVISGVPTEYHKDYFDSLRAYQIDKMAKLGEVEKWKPFSRRNAFQ